VSLGCEIQDIGQTLQWIVYLVRQVICHGRGSRPFRLLHQLLLLPLLPEGHCSEIGKEFFLRVVPAGRSQTGKYCWY
jgi:hypothetical protein